MSLLPAGPDTGIVFRRTDLEPAVEVAGSAHLLREAVMCSTLVNDAGVKIMTIEQLMSAFEVLGLDNCVVEWSAAEIPSLDGSYETMVLLIQSADIQETGEQKS